MKFIYLIFLLTIISCSQAHLKYRAKYISAKSNKKDFPLDKHRFYDKEISANIYAYYDQYMFVAIENLNSNQNLEIVWSKSLYIDPDGESHPVIPNKTNYLTRPEDVPNTIVKPKELHTNNLHNRDSVVFTRNTGWKEYGFITNNFPSGESDALEYAKRIKNKPFFIHLSIKHKDLQKLYELKFRVKKFALVDHKGRVKKKKAEEGNQSPFSR